jgi:hypothetical protein
LIAIYDHAQHVPDRHKGVEGGVRWENRRLKEMEKKDIVHRNVVEVVH